MEKSGVGVLHFIRVHAISSILLVLGILCGTALIFTQNDTYYVGDHAGSYAPAPPETFVLQKMDLTQLVTATGTLQSRALREVNSSLSYKVQTIFVEVGDHVNQGDRLCQLETTKIDQDIADARAGIAQAEASDALKLSQAERKLADAQEQYTIDEQRQAKAIQDALTALEAARVAEATQTANRAVSDQNVLVAREAWLAAEKDLLDPPQFLPDGSLNPAYDADLYQVKLTLLEVATIALENLTLEYQTAWQNMYDTTYATARPEPEATAYEKALVNRETLLRNDRIAIQNAQDTVNTCKINTTAAALRLALEKLLRERATTTITAPVAGTVTAIAARVGSTPSGRSAASSGSDSTTAAAKSLFTIENTGSLAVEARVPEKDAIALAVDMPVTITSDALGGQHWQGLLTAISPVADEAGNFTVRVQLLSASEGLTAGMRANLTMTLASRPGVFAVPPGAVTQNAQGQAVVFQYTAPPTGSLSASTASAGGASGGTPPEGPATLREIPVSVGMQTDTHIEIAGPGLAEGLLIVSRPSGQNTAGFAVASAAAPSAAGGQAPSVGSP